MVLLDSNLVIYALQGRKQRVLAFISQHEICVSVITKIETLGYHRLEEQQEEALSNLFNGLPVLPITDRVVGETIRLRQLKKLSLGDALIAGTARAHGLTLATQNVSDFTEIPGLTVVDPLANV